jgi:signal transduction histidine kinase
VLPNREHLAYLVHDMRSVATSVSLMVDLLELSASAKNNSAQRTRAHSAQQGCQQLALLCAEAAAKIAGSPSQGERFPEFDIVEMLSEATTIYSPIYELSGRDLQFESARDEFQFSGDRQLLFRAVLNLLDNGLKHTPAGTTVWIEFSAQDGQVEISVKDNGLGSLMQRPGTKIPILNFLNRFDPSENLFDVLGSGTGLRFVEHVVELHNGSAVIERHIENGSTVALLLPN